MNSYLDQPTIEKQLNAYLESDDFAVDVATLQNEYSCNGQPIPPLMQLHNETIAQKREWLMQMAICESEGHQFTETADGENGTSELDCDRCGMTFHCQW